MDKYDLKMVVPYLIAVMIAVPTAVITTASAGLAVRPQTGATQGATQGASAPKTPVASAKSGSPLDRRGSAAANATEAALQIVNTGGGLCLDADSGGLNKDGGKVQVWTCVCVLYRAADVALPEDKDYWRN